MSGRSTATLHSAVASRAKSSVGLAGRAGPDDLPSPSEWSAVFHTPRTLEWRRMARLLANAGPKNRATSSGGGSIYSRNRKLHLDFEFHPVNDRQEGFQCIEWDVLVHQRLGPVDPDDLPLSRKLGWLEGFTPLLERAYAGPGRLSTVRCTATFEVSTSRFGNVFGLPRPDPDRILSKASVPLGSNLFSLGLETSDGRLTIAVDQENRALTLGLGFLMRGTLVRDLFATIEREARVRAAAFLTRYRS